MEMSVQDEINKVGDGRPHVVVLGSGGSVAVLLNGDKNGNMLPTMDNFVECLKLDKLLSKTNINYKDKNFEDIYSLLSEDKKYDNLRGYLEQKVRDYFSSLELPDKPNLYDYLILSLRKKDLICTFNWDPFLIQAYQRNVKFTDNIPNFLFLHGNVMTGYCPKHQTRGAINNKCSICKMWFTPSTLLYPITEKNYDKDFYIKREWEIFDWYLNDAAMLTIFGYGAPKNDVKAFDMMKKSWGLVKTRSMEEIEIIDIKSEEDLVNTWDPFIHSDHYQICNDFFDSWIIKHPRRTIEAYFSQYYDAKYIEDNKIPIFNSHSDLWNWYSELINVEKTSQKKK